MSLLGKRIEASTTLDRIGSVRIGLDWIGFN